MADENNIFNNTNELPNNQNPPVQSNEQSGSYTAPRPEEQSGQYYAPNQGAQNPQHYAPNQGEQNGQYYSAPQENAQQYYQPQQNTQGGQYYAPQGNQQYYQQPNYQQAPPQGNPYYQPQQGYNPYAAPMPPQEQKANIGLAILSFFIPIVGIVLCIVDKKNKPKTAKACGISAAVSIVLYVLTLIFISLLPTIANTDFDKLFDDNDDSAYYEEYDNDTNNDFSQATEQNNTTADNSSAENKLGDSRQGYIDKPDGTWADFYNADYHPDSMLGYTNGDIIIIMNYYDAVGYSKDDIRASVDASIENIKANQTDVVERKDQTYTYSDFYGQSSYYVDSTGYKLFTFIFQSDSSEDMIYFTIESPTMSTEDFNKFVNEVINTHSFVNHQLDVEF